MAAEAHTIVRCTLTAAIRQLEQLLGSERYTLMKVAAMDFEARSFHGSVGRGQDLIEAVEQLHAAVVEDRAEAAAAERRDRLHIVAPHPLSSAWPPVPSPNTPWLR